MSSEAKINHGPSKTQRFDMTDDEGVPTETHEEELTDKEKYKKERTEAKKEKMKERVRKNLDKKKAAEDEFMKQAEQEQRDNLAFPTELTGGASASTGPEPPKQPKTPRPPRNRS